MTMCDKPIRVFLDAPATIRPDPAPEDPGIPAEAFDEAMRMVRETMSGKRPPAERTIAVGKTHKEEERP